MTWPALILGGASILGSMYSGNRAAAAQTAANEYNVAIEEARMRNYQGMTRAEAQAANEIAESRRRYGEEQLAPYTTAGEEALSRQRALLGFGTPAERREALASFQASPGQQFLREEQERAILRNASATGGLRSGRTQTELQRKAFDRAQTDYGNYYNRLGGLSSAGLGARSQLAAQFRGTSTTLPPEYQAIDKPGGMGNDMGNIGRLTHIASSSPVSRMAMKAFGGGGGK